MEVGHRNLIVDNKKKLEKSGPFAGLWVRTAGALRNGGFSNAEEVAAAVESGGLREFVGVRDIGRKAFTEILAWLRKKNLSVRVPRFDPHPGEVMRDRFLKPRGLTAQKIAAAIPPDTNNPTRDFAAEIEGFIRARDDSSKVAADLSLALDRFLGLPPGYWWHAQAEYQIRGELANRQDWLDRVPPGS